MLKVVVFAKQKNSIRPSLMFYQAIVAIYILIRAALSLVLLSSDGLGLKYPLPLYRHF